MNQYGTLKMLRAGIVVALIAASTTAAAIGAPSRKELDERITVLEERTEQVERKLDNKSLIELMQRIESLQQEVQELRGETERNAYELDEINRRQKELFLNIDQRLQRLESGEGSTGGDAANIPGATVPAQAATSATGADAYRKSFDLLKKGQYDQSIQAFRRFLNDYPQSPYAANAQYWLAEANYVRRSYDAALVEFKKAINLYPQSPKIPDALLKLGFTHYELKQWQKARKVLTSVQSKYPKTKVAGLAKERLARMKTEGH